MSILTLNLQSVNRFTNPNFASLKAKRLIKNFTLFSCNLFKVFESLYLIDQTNQDYHKSLFLLSGFKASI